MGQERVGLGGEVLSPTPFFIHSLPWLFGQQERETRIWKDSHFMGTMLCQRYFKTGGRRGVDGGVRGAGEFSPGDDG